MALKRDKRRNKQLTLRKGYGIFITTILVFSTLALLVDLQQAEAASGTYSEDFITTLYMDSSNTNVTGWGSPDGVINLQRKTPTLVGSYNTPYFAQGVFVSGDYAYVANGDSGLQVVDISDPTNPTNASAFNVTGDTRDVFVSGDYAYVADGISFNVFNISDPKNLTLAGSYGPIPDAEDVFVDGDYAYKPLLVLV